MPGLFDTVLIANRGEIACRVIATCRRLGIRTVAVYSDADANALHVRLADTAVRLGPPPARESYLAIDRVLEAARQTGAQAIHPGYGFLSENAAFAEACAEAGLVFVGPSAAAIRTMGSKSAAKALVRQSGVPLTPGYGGDDQSPEVLVQHADAIGYPVMIKASAGGGGKGMRRVDAREDFSAALEACKREAAAAFGDDFVLLEKLVEHARHVEVQVFGDTEGNVISLFERDCSVQRRHQKVLEEAPAPRIAPELRAAIAEAARNAARAVNYVGAGTVEFLVAPNGSFYFMEMNTRLQVEHPVTEMITGLDLVEWQLRVAAGEPLPLSQEQVTMRGHAIEARIYAEDPERGFLPSTGRLVHLRTPERSQHVRIDTGVGEGDSITPFYDPMIAKLIVWDETRALALRRMQRALAEYEIVGVANNVAFLRGLVTSPSFVNAAFDTALIEREQEWLGRRHAVDAKPAMVLAALAMILRGRDEVAPSPWAMRDGWRLNSSYTRTIIFAHEGEETKVAVEYTRSRFAITIDDARYEVSGELTDDRRLRAVVNGTQVRGTVVVHLAAHHVFLDGQHFVFDLHDPLAVTAAHHAGESSLLAPMPGRVVAHVAPVGTWVEAGAPLLILEAMKMECTIRAPGSGRVEGYHFAVGDQVEEGVELLRLESDEE